MKSERIFTMAASEVHNILLRYCLDRASMPPVPQDECKIIAIPNPCRKEEAKFTVEVRVPLDPPEPQDEEEDG